MISNILKDLTHDSFVIVKKTQNGKYTASLFSSLDKCVASVINCETAEEAVSLLSDSLEYNESKSYNKGSTNVSS